MDENIEQKHYQRGFNDGYLITKHLSDLSTKLSRVKDESPRGDGFYQGRRQYLLEQAKDKRPAWMKRDRSDKSNDAHKTPDRDIDHDR
jgi:hypothetical protein